MKLCWKYKREKKSLTWNILKYLLKGISNIPLKISLSLSYNWKISVCFQKKNKMSKTNILERSIKDKAVLLNKIRTRLKNFS